MDVKIRSIEKTLSWDNYLQQYAKQADYVLAAIGTLLRLFHFFNNRSLWEDEVYLSTGIVKLKFWALISQPLPYQQKAPLGYLLASKLCLSGFGNHEMALRLFPLICGIASLFIFLPVARYFLKPSGALLAISLLAFSPQLIYHSVEAKQYATELFATILLLYTYIVYKDRSDISSLMAWAAWGSLITWFSFSVIFIMAAIACTLSVNSLLKKTWPTLGKHVLTFSFWFISFGLNYYLFSGKDAHAGWLIDFYVKHDAFMPRSFQAFTWVLHQLFSFLHYPMGFSWFNAGDYASRFRQMIFRFAWIPIIVSVSGLYYLYKSDKSLLLLICSCFVIVFLTSALKLYPFHERLTVFLAPLFILLVAAGGQWFIERWRKSYYWLCLLPLMLLFGPVYNSFRLLIRTDLFGDYKKSYDREAFFYLDQHYHAGDMVYVYWNDLPAYDFYKMVYPLKYTGIRGGDYRYQTSSFVAYFNRLDTDFKAFKGKKRVWIIFNNHFDIAIGNYISKPSWYYAKNNGPELFQNWLLKNGQIIESFRPEKPGVASNLSVWLMDLGVNRKDTDE
jgi:hypothetical protein